MTGVPIENIVQPHHNNGRSPSIAEARPEIAVEWYYQLNCGFSPNEFSAGSNVYAWWQCERDPQHIWSAQICKRCYDNRDCPFCFGKNLRKTPVIKERSLEFLYPELCKEWHNTRNGDLKPSQVLAGSHLKVWWRCSKNKRHVWQAVIKSRVAGRGCRCCYEETFLDLSDFPDILKLFDQKKNKLYDPHKLTTDMVLWWRCPKGPDHSWQSAFNKKSLLCKCCRNRQVSVTNSLATLYPKVAMQLHPTRNVGQTAQNIMANSSQKVWWRCPLNPSHIWQAVVRNRTCNGSRCPKCFNERRSNKKQRRSAT